MDEKCKNCGAEKGIHHYLTDQCPAGGKEAPINKTQEWKTSTFEPGMSYDDLVAQRDELLKLCRAALWELDGHLEKGTTKPQLEAAIARCEKDEISCDDGYGTVGGGRAPLD